MRALDTNILVRAIVRDDPLQAQAADALFAAGDVLILPTVLMETVWVLKSRYGFERERTRTAVMKLAGLEGVTLASPGAIATALAAYAQAGDFADLLHAALAAEAGADAMVTFDRRFTVPPGTGLAVQIL